MSSNSQSFTFTGPNGEKFTVMAPAGTSESAARAEFDKQFSAGSLKNLGVGQALDGLSKGVADAVNQVKSLTNVPVSLPVTPAEILKQIPATTSVGSLDPKQVTSLLGQATSAASAATAALGSAASTATAGVGKYGLTPQQLEQQGFLKPGTVQQFIGNNPAADVSKILASPTVWAGKAGITNLDGFVSNTNIQNLAQTGLMTQGLDQMKKLGVVTGTESPQQLAAMVQGAAKFGADAMAAWAKGGAAALGAGVASAISGLAKNAQFAVDLAGKLPTVAAATEGVVDTVNRTAVDGAIKGFIGNDKVPPAVYGPVEREPEAPDPNIPAIDKFKAAAEKLVQRANYYQNQAQELNDMVISLEAGVITRGEWELVNDKLQSIRTQYNSERQSLQSEIDSAYNALPASIKPDYLPQYNSVLRLFKIIVEFVAYLKARIADNEALIGT